MHNQRAGSLWITIAVVIVGIGSLVLLSIQPVPSTAEIEPYPLVTPDSTAASENVLVSATAAITRSVGSPSGVSSLQEVSGTQTPVPTATPTPLPPLALPEVPVPEGGQIYTIYPSSSAAVGWARANDQVPNHFGDYNIFSGIFNGQQYVGAFQFDLSQIPPGSPILYADVTLTGLAGDYRGEEGTWTLQMFHGWMDQGWTQRNYYWLAREDSAAVTLNAPVTSLELEVGKPNTFAIPPEGLSLLEARLFSRSVSFRVVGPQEGSDQLFSWDSGFGERSLGRPPLLRVVTAGPAPESPPTPTPNLVIITPVPTDGAALLALAAERLTATAMATPNPNETPRPTPTPTPLPPNWVTPIIVTNTPTPASAETAIWQAQVATAQAIVWGTATATPPNVWTATPLPPPTPTPLIVAYDLLTPTPTPTVTPTALPDLLKGKIIFYSDRTGDDELMVMDPDGSNVSLWTGGHADWIYKQAGRNSDMSPDGAFRVVVSSEQITSLQLWRIDLNTGERFQLTDMAGIAYDPVWSPLGDKIAFVSPAPGNDEIFVINADGTGLTQLTFNDWEWDKHPSWSPDGSQIVFWSNRETRRQQIWIMNADGSDPRNLSNNEYNDWDPIWVK